MEMGIRNCVHIIPTYLRYWRPRHNNTTTTTPAGQIIFSLFIKRCTAITPPHHHYHQHHIPTGFAAEEGHGNFFFYGTGSTGMGEKRV